jgi:ankyrin repeat protein
VLTQKAPPDLEDENGLTAMHRACQQGYVHVVRELLRTRKANILKVAGTGWTPVLYAAASGAADVLSLLVEYAQNKKLHKQLMAQAVACSEDADDGLDVILLGSKYGHKGIIQVALQAGANMQSQDPKGNTPLHLACFGGTTDHLAAVELLLEEGASHNENNLDYYTPLMLAANHQEFCM